MNLPRCKIDLDPSLSRHGGLPVALRVAQSPCCTRASQALPRLARLPPQSPFSLLATDPETAKLSCASELSPCTPFSLHRPPPPLHPILSSQLLKLPDSDSPQTKSEEPPWAPVAPCSPYQITCGPIYKLLSACWFLQTSLITESRDRVLVIIMSSPLRVPGSHRVQRTE